jgi:hypothetical protein
LIKELKIKSKDTSWGLVVHTCNPSYLGERHQKDQGLKPALDKLFSKPYLENTQHKKRLAEWLKW